MVLGSDYECSRLCGGVARVRRDGRVQRLVNSRVLTSASAIAALPDGGAVIASAHDDDDDAVEHDVLRLDSRGRIASRLTRLPSYPGADDPISRTEPLDAAALPDGTVVLAQTYQARVLRLDASNRITVLAGGGREFKDGAMATDVDLGHVWSVAPLKDDAILIGAEKGLMRLDPSGRIYRLANAGYHHEFPGVDDARAVNDDGQPVGDISLSRTVSVAALAGQYPLVLTNVPGLETSNRLALIAPIDRIGRLAVALPPSNRSLLRRGRVDVIATEPARARVELVKGRDVVAWKSISLVRGQTSVRMRIPRSGEAYVLRVIAKTDQSTIATHQLTVIPSRVLPQSVVVRIAEVVAMISEVDVDCRRRAAGRFACTIKRWVGGRPWRGAMYLREDGLITFRQVHRYPRLVIFEPLTMVPDVILEE